MGRGGARSMARRGSTESQLQVSRQNAGGWVNTTSMIRRWQRCGRKRFRTAGAAQMVGWIAPRVKHWLLSRLAVALVFHHPGGELATLGSDPHIQDLHIASALLSHQHSESNNFLQGRRGG